jgi:hypothetical protein
MSGRYVEAGDGYSWVEDAPTAVEKLTADPAWADKDATAKIKALNKAGITADELQSAGVSPSDIAWMQSQGYTGSAPSVTTNIAGANVAAPSSVRTDLATNQEYLNAMASSGETGRTAQEIQSTLAPVMKDLGNGMQASYNPVTGELQNIYNGTNKGGYYDTQGTFIPYQTTSWSDTLSGLPGGLLSGVQDITESQAFKTIAPAVIGGLYSSGAFGGASALTDASLLAEDAARMAADGLSEAAISQNLAAYGSQSAADLAASMAANGLDVTTMTQQLNNLSSNTGLMSQTGSAADFAAADVAQLQGQGLSNAAVAQNVAAGGTTAADLAGTTAATTGTTAATAGSGLTAAQIANLVKAGVSLTGLLGAGAAISGAGTSTQGAATSAVNPTQQQAAYTPEYYNQLQQYYNAYMPQTPRDVVTPLQQWYNSPKVA